MDLRTIANAASNVVNENLPVSIQVSTGYTKDASYKQVPAYAPAVSGFAQLQALSYGDLRQLDGLNIQGASKAIYLRGELAQLLRPNQTGGDLVTIAAPAPQAYWGTWLVVHILESWPNWTKAALQLQGGV